MQSLWIGSALSTMEVMCINSFIKNGHVFHLYVYDEELGNIPEGCIIKNARDILPESEIFTYTSKGSKSGKSEGSICAFANMFRYKLLYEKGGYWVDMDMICLKPFDFPDPYVFSSERRVYEWIKGKWEKCDIVNINAGVIKCPVKSDFALHCYMECILAKNAAGDSLKWGAIGPGLVKQGTETYSLKKYMQSPETFCPLQYPFVKRIFKDGGFTINEDNYAVHLWNEYWKRMDYDKNGIYEDGSFYEYLKKLFL